MIRDLTQCEISVLQAMADGLLLKNIAADRGIVDRSVHAAVRRAKIALGARTAYEAVAIAFRQGLIK